MKPIFFLQSLVVILGLQLSAFAQIPQDWKAVEMYDYGFDFEINLPPGVSIEESYFGVEIKKGDAFALRIWTDKAAASSVLTKYKKETDENKTWKLQEYLLDEDEGFIAKQKLASKEGYTFYKVGTYKYRNPKQKITAANVLSGNNGYKDITYVFSPITAGDYSYTEQDIRLMYAAASSALTPVAEEEKVLYETASFTDPLNKFQITRTVEKYEDEGVPESPPRSDLYKVSYTDLEDELVPKYTIEKRSFGGPTLDPAFGIDSPLMWNIRSIDVAEFNEVYAKVIKKSGLTAYELYLGQFRKDLADPSNTDCEKSRLTFVRGSGAELYGNESVTLEEDKEVTIKSETYHLFHYTFGSRPGQSEFSYNKFFIEKGGRIYSISISFDNYKNYYPDEKAREWLAKTTETFMQDLVWK